MKIALALAPVVLLVVSAPAAAQEPPTLPATGAVTPVLVPPAAPAPALPPAAPAATPSPPPEGSAAPAYGYPPGYGYPPSYGYPAPGYAYPPGYGYPPGYAYPPGYGYPPGYAYPPGYTYPPGYPASPQGTSPIPSAEPITAPPDTEAPVIAPAGRWRLGIAALIVPTGTLSYKLSYRGQAQLAFSGQTAPTAGLRPFAQVDVLRFGQLKLQLGLAMQFIPSIKWANPPASNGDNNAFNGSGYEVDLLPELAVGVNVLPRLRLVAFGAPGYSFFSASELASKVYTDPGTVRGFVIQAGAEVIGSLGEHFFLDGRLANQWGFQSSEVGSLNNNETWNAEVHTNLFSAQVGCGYWF
jgi:hypothetical protein